MTRRRPDSRTAPAGAAPALGRMADERGERSEAPRHILREAQRAPPGTVTSPSPGNSKRQRRSKLSGRRFLPESSSPFRGGRFTACRTARKGSRNILRPPLPVVLKPHRHILRAARLDIYLVITKNLCRQDIQPSRESYHDVHGTSHAPAAGGAIASAARHTGLHIQQVPFLLCVARLSVHGSHARTAGAGSSGVQAVL